MKLLTVKSLTAGVLIASAASGVNAGYYAELTGVMGNSDVVIDSVNQDLIYQGPRLLPPSCCSGPGVAGPGWDMSLNMTISDSGTIDNFQIRRTSQHIGGSDSSAVFVYAAGGGWDKDQANFDSVCSAPSLLADTTGYSPGGQMIEITCAGATDTSGNTQPFAGTITDAVVPDLGIECWTANHAAVDDSNYCATLWGYGDWLVTTGGSFGSPGQSPAENPASELAANDSTIGDGASPELFSSNPSTPPFVQHLLGSTEFLRASNVEYPGSPPLLDTEAANFRIAFTGTLGEADFAITGIDIDLVDKSLLDDTCEASCVTVEESQFFTFNVVGAQGATENIPVIGLVGLATLFGGLTLIGTRLRRTVR